MEDIQLATSAKGKPIVLLSGFQYLFLADGKFKKIWECNRRRYHKCPAKLHTTDDLKDLEILKKIGSHNHEPSAIKSETKKFLTGLRADAKTSTEPPSKVLARHLEPLSSAAKGALPFQRNIKRSIRRLRNGSSASLPIPHRREDINLPSRYRTNSRGENFLLFDSGNETDRIMIFGTCANLQFLETCDTWLVDGTFKVSPPMFEQLFVIHGYRNNTSFPLLFCLTPNRTACTYNKMLKALKDKEPNLSPSIIMSDFERASLNAFSTSFPHAEQKGCYFHFRQAVYRKIQSLSSILHEYSNDSEFSLQLHHLIALAFIPPSEVVSTFDSLMETTFFTTNTSRLAEFIAYFETTWIGAWNRRHTSRNAPMFSIDLWNCYNSAMENKPKTNNNCEGFNRGFSALLGAQHPTIYKLINGLRAEQILLETKIEQLLNGKIPEQPTRLKLRAENLKKIVSDFGSERYTTMEQLRRLAYWVSP